MNPKRHVLEAEALRDYLVCPQKYAYRWLYQIDDHPRTEQQLWDRAVRRTALTIVRERLEGRKLTHDRCLLLWQLHTQNTVVAAKSRWDLRGREAIGKFAVWMTKVTPVTLAPTRTINFELHPTRSIDAEITADFAATWKRKRVRVLLAPPSPDIVEDIASCDTGVWIVYDLAKAKVRTIRKRSNSQARELFGVLEQGLRGLYKKIVWPHRDGRCTPCPFGDICTPGDARPHLLRDATSRRRVQDRASRLRGLRDD